MFEASDPRTQEVFRFRSLDTLTRALRGTTFLVHHSEAFEPTTYEVDIMRPNRKVRSNDVLVTLRVPAEAVKKWREDNPQ